MRQLFKTACVVLLLAHAAASTVHAEIHTYKDWAVACDNTRHCEAVGYQAEQSQQGPVTLFLERDAGPNTPVKGKIMVQPGDDKGPGPLTLKVGKFSLSGLKSEGEITAAQLSQLLPHMLDANEIIVTERKEIYTLSLAGVKAALLKMDEMQGRVETPGALVRKGSKPESSVLPALPAPVVMGPKPWPLKSGDAKLIQPILKAVKERECWDDLPDSAKPETSIHRVSDTQVLVMRECGRAAYQGYSVVWLANDKPPYSPKQMQFPDDSGSKSTEVMNAEFSDGRMQSTSKGRGIGDCLYNKSWAWTGAEFKLTSSDVSAFCRGLPGGGFNLRTWIAR